MLIWNGSIQISREVSSLARNDETLGRNCHILTELERELNVTLTPMAFGVACAIGREFYGTARSDACTVTRFLNDLVFAVWASGPDHNQALPFRMRDTCERSI